MTAAMFRAHCAKGHDRIDFQGEDGAKAFEAHMKGEHKAKTLLPGSDLERRVYGANGKPAPGWARGEIEKPYPWAAPKAPADTSKLTALLLKVEGDRGFMDEVIEWHTPDKITPDDLQAGDVFALKGCEYAVRSVEGDSYTLTMTKGPRAGTARDTAPVARSAFDKLGGDVVLLKRAS